MKEFQDVTSLWKPEDFKRSRKYDRIIKDVKSKDGNLKKGTVVEILKVEKNQALTRVPGSDILFIAVPLDSLSKGSDLITELESEQIQKQ